MPNVAHPPPARVRGKVGSKRSRTKLLAVGQKYISGQAAGDPGNKLATPVAAVTTARTAVTSLVGKRSDLLAQLATNQGALVIADAEYVTSLIGYVDAASTLAGGDASLLTTLGVEQVAAPTKPADETIGTPVAAIKPGVSAGEATLKCRRVLHAGAYFFQYKLEPSQSTDPWLGNVTTKLATTTVSGLAPAQLIRARVQAIGVAAGPWSVEVVGRAK